MTKIEDRHAPLRIVNWQQLLTMQSIPVPTKPVVNEPASPPPPPSPNTPTQGS